MFSSFNDVRFLTLVYTPSLGVRIDRRKGKKHSKMAIYSCSEGKVNISTLLWHNESREVTMIVFDLQCTCGCQFEGWFSSRSGFEKQRVDKCITCPQCGCTEIHKILSPVAIHASAPQCKPATPTPEHADTPSRQAYNALRSIQDFIEKNFEDVGPRLARESLKIHYGVAKPRNIRGVATEQEEKMLTDEGIELLKISLPAKPTNREIN